MFSRVMKGDFSRTVSDACMPSSFVTPLSGYWPFLWSMDRYLLKKGHAKRGLPTFFTVKYDNNDILQT